MSELPKWVWDLVADLEDEEDVHPKLMTETIDGLAKYDWCPATALARVPDDIRAQARVVAAYRRPGVDPIKAPEFDLCTCPDVDVSTPDFPLATLKGLDRNCPQHGGRS